MPAPYENVRKVLDFKGKAGIVNAVLDKSNTGPSLAEAEQLKLVGERLQYVVNSELKEVVLQEDIEILNAGTF
jgi:hypothetical protein